MLKIIILGALQGATEFLPVSSSGHLVIAQHFLGIKNEVVLLDIFLHTGTILALLVFFFKDILSIVKRPKVIGLIALITLITGIIGITFKKSFEYFFSSAHLVAIFLLINGAILAATRFFKDKGRSPGLLDSIAMGIAQGIAIIPGISRSGLTISTLLALGIKKEEAFSFSFIASIPAILGAFFLEAKDAGFHAPYGPVWISAGVAAAFVFGTLSLFALKKIIQHRNIHWFGYYCIFLGAVVLTIIKI